MGFRAVHHGATAALLLVALAACTSQSPQRVTQAAQPTTAASTASPTSPSATYVALGDSFTAGPGISPVQTDAGMCRRSERDWPTLVAAALERDVTDVSCAGASTADLKTTVESGVVGPGTELVTVSAGGNDGSLFLSLLRACTTDASSCTQFAEEQAPSILDRTTTDLADLLADVRSAAPQATVLLVGYPRIMPTTGTCSAIGVGAADATSVIGAEEALDAALAGAAEQAGVTYVSLRATSEGHDACSGDGAWTNGIAPAEGDGIFFHPNARGMAAVADRVAAATQP